MTVGVLFVCLGNICRSPTADAVFTHKARALGLDSRLHIDSAGTGDWHLGEPPDRRSQRHAAHAASSGLLDVPDPYHGDEREFEAVLDLIEEATDALLAHIRTTRL